LLADVVAGAAVPVGNAELPLQEDPAAREVDVRRQGCEDDAVDLIRLHSRVGQGAARRFDTQVAAGDGSVRGCIAPLFDAGPRPDPLVVHLGLLFGTPFMPFVQERNFVVRNDTVGNMGPQAQDPRTQHQHLRGPGKTRGKD